MINRYSTAFMNSLWSEENKYRVWLDVEIAACKAWNEMGAIPDDALQDIETQSAFSVERIHEIESEVHHDVIAFVTNVAENVGNNGRYIHLGLTSSDIIDTASSVLLKQGLEYVENKINFLSEDLFSKAELYKMVPCVGRTHGIHAEPLTFGLKLLNWYSQLQRDLKRLQEAKEVISFGKLSGAVGTYAHCPPEVEEKVCKDLGLIPSPVATQILQRDRHAQVMNALSLLASSIERFAVEIRHLQRTEVLEVLEPFGKKQKGSSAMPHKKNPIICERLTGMSRLLRGYSVAAMENIALWHERDISHSSVERVIWPDAFSLIDYMLDKFHTIVQGMVVQKGKMEENLNLTKGLVYSQRVLLQLVEQFNMKREEAYSVVQENAMRCWNGEGQFLDLLLSDGRLSGLITKDELEALFDYNYYYRYVNTIFDRFKG